MKKNFIKMDMSGLERMQKNVKEMSGKNNIPLSELVEGDLLEKIETHFDVKSQEEFENIDKDHLNQFISENTTFKSFDELLEAGVAGYIKKNLFK